MNSQVDKIKRIALKVLLKNGVKKAAIFGSVARGESKKNSDIDLLIEFKGRKSLLDLIGLELELEKLLKKKVEVITYNSIHPLIRDRILAEQKVIL